jgi:ABC-type proline/glycine betaine transport system permease subunit
MDLLATGSTMACCCFRWRKRRRKRITFSDVQAAFESKTSRIDMEQQSLVQFMMQQWSKLLDQTLAHIGLTFISLFIAVLAGLPLGIYIARNKRFSGAVLGFAGVLQTIPSIALLGFLIPLLGIGPLPAIAALFSICFAADYPQHVYRHYRSRRFGCGSGQSNGHEQ